LANSTSLPILKSLFAVVAEILKGNSQFWEATLAQGYAHFSSGCDFMMGLGKPQRIAKFGVAGFIYNGNIREFVSKIWINQNGENPYFGGKLTLPLDSQTQCFLFNV